MTKRDLIRIITSEMNTRHDSRITQDEVAVILDTITDKIKDALAVGGKLELRGFGVFSVKTRRATIGRDINRNIAIKVPEKNIPIFTPYDSFLAKVNDENK